MHLYFPSGFLYSQYLRIIPWCKCAQSASFDLHWTLFHKMSCLKTSRKPLCHLLLWAKQSSALTWQALTHCGLSIYHPTDALRDTPFMTECIWWMMYWCKNMHIMRNIKNPLLTNPSLWNIPTRTIQTLSSWIRVEYYKMLLAYLKHHKLLPTVKGVSFTYQIHPVCKGQCTT